MRVLLAVAAALFLSGCGSIPPMNFSVPNVGPSAHKLTAELKSITVSVARPDEKTGGIDPNSDAVVPLWKTSVEEALNKMAIFDDDAPRKVSLSVKILKLEPPTNGLTMTSDVAARYELLDRKTGAVIFTTDVSTEASTPLDYALLGVARMRESVNRAAQNNIAIFLQRLETVDLARPMFPATQPPAVPAG